MGSKMLITWTGPVDKSTLVCVFPWRYVIVVRSTRYLDTYVRSTYGMAGETAVADVAVRFYGSLPISLLE